MCKKRHAASFYVVMIMACEWSKWHDAKYSSVKKADSQGVTSICKDRFYRVDMTQFNVFGLYRCGLTFFCNSPYKLQVSMCGNYFVCWLRSVSCDWFEYKVFLIILKWRKASLLSLSRDCKKHSVLSAIDINLNLRVTFIPYLLRLRPFTILLSILSVRSAINTWNLFWEHFFYNYFFIGIPTESISFFYETSSLLLASLSEKEHVTSPSCHSNINYFAI